MIGNAKQPLTRGGLINTKENIYALYLLTWQLEQF